MNSKIVSCFSHIYLCTESADFRKGVYFFISYVKTRLQLNPLDPGILYVFTNKRHKKIKVLYFDGDQFWMSNRDLDEGTYKWGSYITAQPFTEISPEQFRTLMAGQKNPADR